MLWPSPQDYNEAIQNPSTCFTDVELKGANVALGPLGLPHPVTGAFSSVYRLETPANAWAVRCFLRPVLDQQQRYACISQADLTATTSLVGFRYLPEGIKAGAKAAPYPILKMEWIDGETLDRYIMRNLKSPAMLFGLVENFLCMLEELEKCGVAHGDLQHGNVLVARDKIKLVDYDNMFVPALKGAKSNELGHRNYQHPERAEHFGPHLDRFSAWVIASSIISIACDPSLWDELNAGDECLLYRSIDFKNPNDSKAFSFLCDHQIEMVRELASRVRAYAVSDIDCVPPLVSSDIRNMISKSGISTTPIVLPTEIARTALTLASNTLQSLQSSTGSKRVVKRSLGVAREWSSITVKSIVSWFLGIPAPALHEIRVGDKVFAHGDYAQAKEHYLNALNLKETELLRVLKVEPATPWTNVPEDHRPLIQGWQEPLLLLLGICYARLHQFSESAACLKGCVNIYLRKRNGRLQALSALLLGAVCFAAGEKEKAFNLTRLYSHSVQKFKEATALDLVKPLKDEVITFLIALGDDCAPDTDRETAVACYKTAYQLDIENPDPLLRLGMLETRSHNLENAHEYFDHAYALAKSVAVKQLSALAMWSVSTVRFFDDSDKWSSKQKSRYLSNDELRKLLNEDPISSRRLELDSGYAGGSFILALSEHEGFVVAADEWAFHLLKHARYEDAARLVSIALKSMDIQTAPTYAEINLRFTVGFANWLGGRHGLALALFKDTANRLSSNLPYRVPYHALASLCVVAILNDLRKEEEARSIVKEWIPKRPQIGFKLDTWLDEGGRTLLTRFVELELHERMFEVVTRSGIPISSRSLIVELVAVMRMV